MKRNYIMAFGITVAALAILAFAAWVLFETEPTTKLVSPSREARRNPYLALDRWLESSGVSARIENSGDLSMISQAGERHIFIQASLFRWKDEAVESLISWVEDGGNLFLVLDYQTIPRSSYLNPAETWTFREDEPFLLLNEFGITVETGMGNQGRRHDSGAPSFERDISFQVSEDSGALLVRDWTGLPKLVQVKRGSGTLTVSGRPRFLYSDYLDDAPNTRLAWALFAGEANSAENGWLFIRGTTKVRGLLGSLWQEGNFPALVVSLLVLLVICFWAVLPLFGLVKKDDEKPLKALRERFLAEGRFLKSHGALDMYRDTYTKEIKRRLALKEGLVDNNDIENRVLEIWGRPREKSALLLKAFRAEHFSYSEFPKMVIIFKTILEQI